MSSVTKLVVGSTFGIYPPRGGGQLRIFHLYRQLAARCPVDVVALVDHDEDPARRELAPGLTEIRIPKSAAHLQGEAKLQMVGGPSVADAAFIELHKLTPEFSKAVAASAIPGSVLVASHPYAFPAMRSADRRVQWWYDAHNVEADLKAGVLPSDRIGKRLLARTRSVERDCCKRARLVLAVSADDRERLGSLYRVPRDRLRLIPNGIDTSSIRFTPPSERRELQGRLRMQQPLALFIGSWHEPNLLAARRIFALARALPDVQFAIAGSAGLALGGDERPANVELFGVVTDELKQSLLGIAAVALNPMLAGSGTNMKMLDYLAAGLPVISTAVGARGLGLEPGADFRVAEPTEFGDALRAVLAEPADVADARARAARQKVEEQFDWKAVAAPLLAEIGPPERPIRGPA